MDDFGHEVRHRNSVLKDRAERVRIRDVEPSATLAVRLLKITRLMCTILLVWLAGVLVVGVVKALVGGNEDLIPALLLVLPIGLVALIREVVSSALRRRAEGG